MAKVLPEIKSERSFPSHDVVSKPDSYALEKKHAQVQVLDVKFDNVTLLDMREHIMRYMHTDTAHNLFVVTANPEIVHYASEEPLYQNIITKADYIIPDGTGIVKAARILGQPLQERVPGIEVMEQCLDIADIEKRKVFLLGATSPVVEKAARRIKKQYPNLIIQTHHGFIDITDPKVVEVIHDFNPDFIFVGMGYPKQEQWIQHHRHHFDHTMMMGVGGSIDVFSGEVKRAPYMWRALNLEWVYRGITDIKRIHRFKRIPKFILAVYKQKYFKN
ncbi:WecB/TagA/CpsF family glycosyltransferase [Staphylococcus agnetis]|uniref:N-acetylglucosaminyldiphosphoundecaprenol N-acetyl-beta-D-mannosaminyltransferase TarA n=1 Tax=Staphylococcus agnetis TaxID=985762 RepID=UPI00208DECA3|nr:N-acetylglucosaminyldiphosphoundecaprenol N-acetyl-beta-D-mannosaminyltransferase TarA [Staphylococcus agnetis]MCO4341839.1 WecB/TagA/CpsF family glycosyltransferase [Staphylococcus agnetis]MCO4344376.1 WecB/TagA/CpsF family glycosyltransferase [Staphylococcus agnetis]MCO4367824.1 WecB/TagA/CpsF family glycosyltransferase [Staphylococcus agnetis]